MDTKKRPVNLASPAVILRRLEWAVDFAQRPALGEAPAVCREVALFLEPLGRVQIVPTVDVAEMDASELRSLQEAVFSVLSLFAGTAGTGKRGGYVPPVQVERTFNRGPKGAYIIVEGAPRDVVLDMLTYLLIAAPDDCVRQCKGCERVLVKAGKRTHCTTKCLNAHTWRTLPADKVDQYRQNQYKANNWKRGARVQGGATEVKTRGVKAPQVSKVGHKKARQSTKGISGL